MNNPDELILSTAVAVEKALFDEHGFTNPKYKAKFRSKYLNLKDKANPQLRSILLQGIITASHFISMTATEMASEERRSSNLALQEENLKNTKAAQDTSAETDQFKCGRCKQRKCKYYQLQTRSADEPMTTFVTCINCNNRWKVHITLCVSYVYANSPFSFVNSLLISGSVFKSILIRFLCFFTGAIAMSSKPATTKPEDVSNSGFARFFDPSVQAPLRYVITPLFYGVTAGPIYGGVTGIMMNMAGTADMHTRVLRHTALFSSMGLAFGLAGIGSMLIRSSGEYGRGEEKSWEEADDFTTRFTSGCAAGVTLGLASTKIRFVLFP